MPKNGQGRSVEKRKYRRVIEQNLNMADYYFKYEVDAGFKFRISYPVDKFIDSENESLLCR